MDFSQYTPSAIWRRLEETERQLAYGFSSRAQFDSFGRPLSGAWRAPDVCSSGVIGRVMRVRQALDDSQEIALRLLQQDFGQLSLDMIWPMLKAIAHDVALYVGGGALAGGAIGGGLGALAGGVGAAPGAIAGSALGMQVGNLVLQFIGIKELAQMVIKYVPEILSCYLSGLQHAWGPLPGSRSCNSGQQIESYYQPGYAAAEIARGHKLVTYALLMGMVAYMLRSGGTAQKLMAEIAQNSRLGPKVAAWLEKNHKALMAEGRLRPAHNRAGGAAAEGGAAKGGNSAAGSGAKSESGAGAGKSGASASSTAGAGSSGSGGSKAGNSTAAPAERKPADGKPAKDCACTLVGHPVDALSGAKVLLGESELDFVLPGIVTLAWQRSYTSDNPHISWLGQGWSLPLTLALSFSSHSITLLDAQHRGIRFPRLDIGEEFYSRHTQMTLARVSHDEFTLQDKDGWHYRFRLFSVNARIAQLIEHSDAYGNAITLDYPPISSQQAQHVPQQIRDSAGRLLRLEFAHSQSGPGGQGGRSRLLAVWLQQDDSAEQALVRYEYDEQGDLIRVLDRSGQIQREFAWRNHIMIRHSQPGGLSAEYEYTEYAPHGKVTRSSANSGQSWRFEYAKQQTRVVDNLGRSQRFHFDADKRFIGATDPQGGKRQRKLDPWGNLLEESDQAGHTERHSYDMRSRLLQSESADGAITRYEYSGQFSRLPSAITDALGHTTRIKRDQAGQPLHISDALGHHTVFERDARGLVSAIVDGNGKRKQLEYNAAGQLTRYTDCSGQLSQWEYDAQGRLLHSTDALGQMTRYEWDAAGRLRRVSYPDGTSESYEYDAIGRLRSQLDAQGQRTSYSLDALGRVLERRNALGGRLAYRYDDAQRLAQLINENGAVWQFQWDVLDRLISETGFDGRHTEYRHDAAGQVLEKIEHGVPAADPEIAAANRIHTHFQRDALGRLLHKRVQRGAETAQETRYRYDLLGRLCGAANAHSQVEMEYDALGQLLAERSQLLGADGQAGPARELRHVYDALGNRIQSILPDQRKLNFLYYGSGHLHQINLDGQLISDIERDVLHRSIKRSQGELESHFRYDPAGRLRQQRVQYAGWQGEAGGPNPASAQAGQAGQTGQTGAPVIARDYHYDALGNLQRLYDLRSGQSDYVYDVLGRITGASLPGLQERFAFDPAHNLLPAQEAPPVQDNRLQRYGDKRYAYDAHGNLRRKQNGADSLLELEWDAQHQLRTSSNTRKPGQADALTQQTEYGYDPFGRRIFKRDRFGVTHFHWDGNRLLMEGRGYQKRLWVYDGPGFVPLAQVDDGMPLFADQAGQAAAARLAAQTGAPDEADPDATIVLRRKPAASAAAEASAPAAPQVAQGQVLYFHTDHLGTPRELSDAQGRLRWQASYQSWGNLLQVAYSEISAPCWLPQLQPLRFQGQYYDAETGLHYNRFRYYDPDIGRFISQDPIGLAGGNNIYQYAANPISWIDPLGLSGIPYGFSSYGQFKQFGEAAQAGLTKAGYPNTQFYMQGSAATGVSFETKAPFDLGRVSDFDVAIVNSDLLAKADSLGLSKGNWSEPIKMGSDNAKNLGINDTLEKLSRMSGGREVNGMIFKDATNAKGKATSISIPVKCRC
ncbi:DUF6861 domain-containing protein [Massilia sp. W12]|uniref:DUF6861 domain-containing protein n=1 Tax=Massilia sp. W12 TaxID=3126507 RepID=UPI0030D037F3